MTAPLSNDPLRHDLHGIAIYNPDLLSEQELKTAFIARQDLLERLSDGLRAERPAHSLIVGARGMGKTTLLRRLKYEIHDDAALAARWLPLVFPEEQYNVTRLSDFYLNCLDALSDTLESLGDSNRTQEVDRFIQELSAESATTIATVAREGLQEMSRRLERRFVLLADNVERILDDLTEEEGWAFRDGLSEEHGMVLIGASTQAVESTYEYNQPFYDFFKVWEISGFTAEETERVLRRLAEATHNPQVIRWIDGDRARLRTLHNLSGGNPRTVVLLFQLLVQGVEGDVRSDLERLLDMCTPHYKARIEQLPAQGQQILDALAMLWEPATAAQVAEKARLEVTTVSSQIARLVRQGVVEKVALPPGRRIGFQIAERFFNIWYLMRSGRRVRRRLLWLAQFLKMFYSAAERRQRVSAYLQEAPMDASSAIRKAEYGFALAQSVSETEHSAAIEYRALALLNSTTETRSRINELLDLDGEDHELKPVAERLRLMAEARECVFTCRVDAWPEELDRTEFWHLFGGNLKLSAAEKQRLAANLQELGADSIRDLHEILREAKRVLADTIFRGTDGSRLLDQFYTAIMSGYLRGPADLASAEIAAQTLDFTALPTIVAFWSAEAGMSPSEDVYRRFLQLVPDSPGAWNGLGNLLKNQLARYEDAEQAYRTAIQIDPGLVQPWNNLGVLLSDKRPRYEDAEQMYRKAIEIDPGFVQPWSNLGMLLSEKLARFEDAEQAYRKAIEIDPNLAYLWNNLGILLKNRLARYEDAEQMYRKAIEVDPKLAQPWSNLGILLSEKLARYEDAEQAYRKAIEVDPDSVFGLSGLAWFLYQHRPECLDEAERVGKRAFELHPRNPLAAHAYATILVRNGRWFAAMEPARRFLETDDDAFFEQCWPDIVTFFREAALTGHAEDSAKLLHECGKSAPWRPLVEALTAVAEGSTDRLLRLAPEMRTPASEIYDDLRSAKSPRP